jgi:hypothetical protein
MCLRREKGASRPAAAICSARAAASGAALCATASNRDGGLEAEILVLLHQLNLLRQRDCI